MIELWSASPAQPKRQLVTARAYHSEPASVTMMIMIE
jgi:hypothetical protein